MSKPPFFGQWPAHDWARDFPAQRVEIGPGAFQQLYMQEPVKTGPIYLDTSATAGTVWDAETRTFVPAKRPVTVTRSTRAMPERKR